MKNLREDLRLRFLGIRFIVAGILEMIFIGIPDMIIGVIGGPEYRKLRNEIRRKLYS